MSVNIAIGIVCALLHLMWSLFKIFCHLEFVYCAHVIPYVIVLMVLDNLSLKEKKRNPICAPTDSENVEAAKNVDALPNVQLTARDEKIDDKSTTEEIYYDLQTSNSSLNDSYDSSVTLVAKGSISCDSDDSSTTLVPKNSSVLNATSNPLLPHQSDGDSAPKSYYGYVQNLKIEEIPRLENTYSFSHMYKYACIAAANERKNSAVSKNQKFFVNAESVPQKQNGYLLTVSSPKRSLKRKVNKFVSWFKSKKMVQKSPRYFPLN